jgi:acetyl esterase/lipase
MKQIAAILLAACSLAYGQTQAAPPDLKNPPINPEFIALPKAQASVVPVEHKNITYLHASNVDLQLDVYQQPGGIKAPVVVYFHGGAWWKNARPKSAASFHSLLSMGFSIVTVDYRLTGVAPAPAAIQDARCSLTWVKKNASTYHFDLNDVIVFGTSSGGHQALMAGMLPADNAVDLPECREQPKIAAILDFYGISDVKELLGDNLTLQRSTKNWIANASDPQALAIRMSPLTYVRRNLPPTFIVHGDTDPVVPYTQSTRLRDALKSNGVPVELITVPGGQHGKFTAEQSLSIGKSLHDFLSQQNLLPMHP